MIVLLTVTARTPKTAPPAKNSRDSLGYRQPDEPVRLPRWHPTPGCPAAMTVSSLSRALAAVSYFVRLGLRSPTEFASVPRTLAASFLDLQFSHSSPLPFADTSLLEELQRHEVTVPAFGQVLPGNQELRGLVSLVSLGRLLDARSVFEIGTYNGLTALTLARNLPKAVVHTLDLPPSSTPVLEILPSDRGNLIDFPQRAYEGTPEEKRIVQHLGDSAQFDFSPFRGACDLVYVDGAHSFEYVKSDTEAAFEMVRAKGAIVWDDYWRRVPDVPRYLHTLTGLRPVRLPETRLVMWLNTDVP